ncbi:hypothetical protein KACHI17_12770 [Sediminibacterium sp. KACHI17]|uniref:Uncharacterized protein n=1 Tax=Sediminibacterium sp. KACHI17 TaxID=1751071 RepID=A0AAT9GII9_9BACT
MNDTFQELNDLIHEGTQSHITETIKEQKRKEATLKARELEKKFTGTFLWIQCKKALRTMVMVMIKALHIWLEKIYRNRPTDHKRNRTNEQLEIWCTDTLDFIRRHFPEHFNPHEPMPHCLWEIAKEKQDADWESLSAIARENVSETALIAILRMIYQSQLHKTGTHSYYHTEYWTELLSVLPSEQPGLYEDTTTAMIFTLIRRNCNHPLFIHFMIERCTLQLTENANAIEHWVRYLHWVDRIPLIDLMGAEPEQPSVKDQLKAAIQAELIHSQELEKKDIDNGKISSHLLFQTTLSVSQLAAFFRVLIEAGILTTDNNKELMRVVSQTFRTSRTNAPISSHHLYDKFYTLERPALSILKTHITTMLQKTAKLSN